MTRGDRTVPLLRRIGTLSVHLATAQQAARATPGLRCTAVVGLYYTWYCPQGSGG
jgi:hypothetical protein